MSREQAKALGAECDTCPFNKAEGPVFARRAPNTLQDTRKPLVPVLRIWAVSEQPGHTEVATGEPLTGRAGWRLWRSLSELGIEERAVSATNATACFPAAYRTAGDWGRAISACRPRLVAETRGDPNAQQPGELCLLLGERALQSVSLYKSRLREWFGFPIGEASVRPDFRQPGRIWFPTFQPADILREPYLLPIFRADLARALSYARGELQVTPWPNLEIEPKAAEQWFRALVESLEREHREGTPAHADLWLVGLDIETAGKEPLQAETLCVAIARQGAAVSFDYRSRPEFVALLHRLFAIPKVCLVLQNGNHDWTGLEAQGFTIRCQFVDILNAARTRLPGIAHDLQQLIRYFLFVEPHKLLYRDDKGSEVFEQDARSPEGMKRLMLYNAKDAWTQLMVWLKLRDMLEDES